MPAGWCFVGTFAAALWVGAYAVVVSSRKDAAKCSGCRRAGPFDKRVVGWVRHDVALGLVQVP